MKASRGFRTHAACFTAGNGRLVHRLEGPPERFGRSGAGRGRILVPRRPDGALIDPVPHQVHLRFRQGTTRRHLAGSNLCKEEALSGLARLQRRTRIPSQEGPVPARQIETGHGADPAVTDLTFCEDGRDFSSGSGRCGFAAECRHRQEQHLKAGCSRPCDRPSDAGHQSSRTVRESGVGAACSKRGSGKVRIRHGIAQLYPAAAGSSTARPEREKRVRGDGTICRCTPRGRHGCSFRSFPVSLS